jgi:predicted enzyme related to lactoylglutathione lyase
MTDLPCCSSDYIRGKEVVVISGVSQVIVPVGDQERAKEFWTRVMGFELRTDAPYGEGERWIEVAPPQGGPLLVLSPCPTGEPRREVPDDLPHSPVFFACDDIEQTHRELSERGVEFPTPPTKMDFGWWALFEDDEGTRYALGQRE